MMEEESKRTFLKNKASCLKVGELLEVLKDKRFDGESPIIIHSTAGGISSELIAVVRCGEKSCTSPHLIAVPIGAKEIKMKFSGKEKYLIKRTPDIVSGEFDVIENDELVAALEGFDAEEKVAIRVDIDNPENNEMYYSDLLSVSKCSPECPAIHLSPGYAEGVKAEYHQEGDEKRGEDDDQDEIIMKNKLIDGEYVSVGELLESLESKHFADDAAIMINSTSSEADTNQALTVVFKCAKCRQLHFVGGKPATAKKIILNGAIFINHLRDSSSIKKQDLIPVLRKLDPHTKVSMQNIKDDGDCGECIHYNELRSVLKCRPTCPIVHLGIAHWGGKEFGGGVAETGAAKLN